MLCQAHLFFFNTCSSHTSVTLLILQDFDQFLVHDKNISVYCGVYKMKLKDGLILREVAGQYVIVPTGKRVKEITGIVYISSSAAYLWDYMKDHEFEREDLADLIMKEYDGVTREKALADIDHFLEVLTKNNIIDDGIARGRVLVRVPKEFFDKMWEKHKDEVPSDK